MTDIPQEILTDASAAVAEMLRRYGLEPGSVLDTAAWDATKAAAPAIFEAGRRLGQDEKLDAKRRREVADAVEKAVSEAVEEWAEGATDIARLAALLEGDPHAPALSDDPYARRQEMKAIIRAVCKLGGVEL